MNADFDPQLRNYKLAQFCGETNNLSLHVRDFEAQLNLVQIFSRPLLPPPRRRNRDFSCLLLGRCALQIKN